MNPADVLTKDAGNGADLFRSLVKTQKYTMANEDEVMSQRLAEKEERQRNAQLRAMQNDQKKTKPPPKSDDEEQEALSTMFLMGKLGVDDAMIFFV